MMTHQKIESVVGALALGAILFLGGIGGCSGSDTDSPSKEVLACSYHDPEKGSACFEYTGEGASRTLCPENKGKTSATSKASDFGDFELRGTSCEGEYLGKCVVQSDPATGFRTVLYYYDGGGKGYCDQLKDPDAPAETIACLYRHNRYGDLCLSAEGLGIEDEECPSGDEELFGGVTFAEFGSLQQKVSSCPKKPVGNCLLIEDERESLEVSLLYYKASASELCDSLLAHKPDHGDPGDNPGDNLEDNPSEDFGDRLACTYIEGVYGTVCMEGTGPNLGKGPCPFDTEEIVTGLFAWELSSRAPFRNIDCRSGWVKRCPMREPMDQGIDAWLHIYDSTGLSLCDRVQGGGASGNILSCTYTGGEYGTVCMYGEGENIGAESCPHGGDEVVPGLFAWELSGEDPVRGTACPERQVASCPITAASEEGYEAWLYLYDEGVVDTLCTRVM